MSEGENLKQLGSNDTKYLYDNPTSKTLETFKNQYGKNPYTVLFETDEFTSLCPKTGQPDFAEISIKYTPKAKCVETKSLKLYLFSYRNHGSFMETITNKIKDDLVKVLDPVNLFVIGQFKIRGGIKLTVEASYYEK